MRNVTRLRETRVATRAVIVALSLVATLAVAAAPAAALPPSNDDFVGARLLSGTLPLSITGSNVEATKEPGEPNHAGNGGGASVWYRWTPAAAGVVAIDTCSSPTFMDTLLGVYTGIGLDALTEVATNDDGCPLTGAPHSRVVFDAVPGTEYLIAVDGFDGEQNGFTLTIGQWTPPPNDDLAGAQDVGGPLPLTVTGNNVNATKEQGEPNHAGYPGGASVWYRWAPAATGEVEIDTCVQGFDTLLAVYTGTAVDALTLVASNDEGCGPGGRSKLAFNATAGVSYVIAVDSFGPGQGEFTLTIADASAPPNDAFADAEELSGPLPITVHGDNVTATKEPGEPDHAGNPGGASVWYRWTPSASVNVEIDTCGLFGFDTLLAVFTGSAVDALEPVASNDDDCSVMSRLDVAVTAGTTYLIAVDGFGGAEGGFTLTLTDAATRPVNDDFDAAQVVSGPLPITTPGSNLNATTQPAEPTHVVGPPLASVWYRWTPEASGPVTIETCAPVAFFQTELAVYTGSALSALTRIQADAGQCFLGFLSRVTVSATAGTPYSIAVASVLPDSGGQFTLTIRSGAPPNDNLADAELLGGELPIRVAGSMVDATDEVDEPNHLGDPNDLSAHRTVWYRWTAAAAGRVTVETCDSAVDTALAVYTGGSYDELTLVGANRDACGRQSQVTLAVEIDTTYLIAVVGGDDTSPGDIVLTIRQPGPSPSNDAFADARGLTGPLPLVAHGTNVDATTEPGEGEHAGGPSGASIWYRWTPARSGDVVVETCGSPLDTLLAVYTGTTVDALTEVASDDDQCFAQSRVRFSAAAGTTYDIAVAGWQGSQGAVRLTIRSADTPPNDDFANATVLTGSLPIHAGGSNRDATFEPGEPPDYVAAGLGASVWYRWTPAATGEAVVETCGSAHFTVLSIWTGATVNGLSRVPGENIDGCGDDDSIRFPATAGTTYNIAVDGGLGVLDEQNNNDVGDFHLTIRRPQPPTNDGFATPRTLTGRLPISVRDTNIDATAQPGEPSPDPQTATDTSVWYRWTAATSEPVVFETCGSAVNARIGVFTGGAVDALTPVAADGSSWCGRQMRFRFTPNAGTIYRIVVAGMGDQGDVRLAVRLADPPANDAFASPQTLGGGLPITIAADNADADTGREPGEPHIGGDDIVPWIGGTLWYLWTPGITGGVIAATCGSDINTAIAVYTGSSFETLVQVATNTDQCGRQSSVRFVATAGTTYRIAIASEFADQGAMRLVVRRPDAPSNDDLIDAQVLRTPVTITGSNLDATAQPGEPRHSGLGVGLSIWYRWTPRETGQVAIDTCDSGISTALAVYTGPSVDTLQRIASSADQACGDQSMVVFTATTGTTYSIAIDGVRSFSALGVEGPVRLTFTCDDRRCR